MEWNREGVYGWASTNESQGSLCVTNALPLVKLTATGNCTSLILIVPKGLNTLILKANKQLGKGHNVAGAGYNS